VYLSNIFGGEWECKGAVHQLIADFKKAYNSVRRDREVLYLILMEFDIPMKLVWLREMCINAICSEV
jgi:hypothetical protein